MAREKRWLDRVKNNPFAIGGIIFGVIAVFVVLLWFFVLRKTANVNVAVAPISATVKIDGVEYDNGTHRIVPGTYSVKISKDGFTPYEGMITVGDGETANLHVFLLEEGGGMQWYLDHPEDQMILNTIGGSTAGETEAEFVGSDPIFAVTPHYDERNRFNIKARKSEGKNTIIVFFNTCAPSSADIYKVMALEWLRGASINPDNYNMEYTSLCD